MKLLLDTHVLLWWLSSPRELSDEAQGVIANPDNLVFYSAVSTWEMAIKSSLGKLPSLDWNAMLQHLKDDVILPLSITPEHTLGVVDLARHHSDPFDRLLVSQVIHEVMTLVTKDNKMQAYDISTILA